VVPTCTLPKLMLAGLAVRLPGLTPVPVMAIAKFEFPALVATVRLPVAAPADVGANVIANVAL
jgi:hypothetical protein